MNTRLSTVSFASLTVTSKLDEYFYDDMTEEELEEAIKDIVHCNLLLKLENDVFERYLTRRDPDSLQAIAQILETAKRVQKIAPRNYTSPSASASVSLMTLRDRTSASVSTISGIPNRVPKKPTRITYAQRIEMVNTELRELQEDLVKLKRMVRKKKIYLRAQMDENDITIRETRKTREEFEEHVVEKGVDSITGKIPAEKFIRFAEEWLKASNIMMERIRLKIITLKCQTQKVRLQLDQRREFGEALRVVDFEQLKIEIQECARRLEEKNLYLLDMKRIAGHYSIQLTRHKQKLGGLMSVMHDVKDKIIFKHEEVVKLKSDQTIMEVEIKKMEEQLKTVTELMEDFHVPRIIDFIKMRAKLHESHRIHKQLSRQRKIQQITLR